PGGEIRSGEITRAQVRGGELAGAEVRGRDLTGTEVRGGQLTGAEVRGRRLGGKVIGVARRAIPGCRSFRRGCRGRGMSAGPEVGGRLRPGGEFTRCGTGAVQWT